MKTIKIVTLLTLIAFASCKKDNPMDIECPTPKAETYEWKLDKAEYVTRKTSDNSITHRMGVVSYLFNYDHKLKDGIYYQSAIDSNNYTVAGSYSGNKITFNIGDGVEYVMSYEEGDLILERILYSIDTTKYVTERNTFKPKN